MVNEKRLIDANAVLRKMNKRREDFADGWKTIEAMPDNARFKYEENLECALMIGDAPTVDAVEVVHGRWLPDMEEFDDDPAVGIRGGVFQTGWKCSICGRSEPVKEPYCNCGAKMDLE